MSTGLQHVTRVVHRYCGRQHGGHCEVARSEPLDKAVEPLVHRRSDLAGEDLGHSVPPYFSGYPLPDGRYAFARTRYLEDADCLGAVRTESLLLTPEQQRELAHPLLLLDAFDEPADLGAELRAVRAAAGPHDLPPRDVSNSFSSPSPAFPTLLALDDDRLEPLLHAYCGPLPVAIVGGSAALLAELLRLAPNPWALGLCTQALSHRDWARVQTVPAEAAERFVLRAARDKDVAVVDLQGRRPAGVAHAPLAAWIHQQLRAGQLESLLALVARAAQVSAYAAPSDLAAQIRFEELSQKQLQGAEVIEHVNHLKVRDAPAAEVAAAFAPLLGPAEAGRAGFTLNVLRTGWLPTDPGPEAGDAVAGLLEQAAGEGAGRALLAFLDATRDRFADAHTRGLRAAVARLRDSTPWAEREDGAWRDLAQASLGGWPEEVSAVLAERAPWFSESELDRALAQVRELGDASETTWLQLVDAAAATAAAPFAAVVRAASREPRLRRELALRVAARAPQDPSLIGELTMEWAFPELPYLYRGLSPSAWSTAAEVLRERVDSVDDWDAGGGRAMARLAALGRGDEARQDLARDHALHLFRTSGERGRLLDTARRKAVAGARGILLRVLNALRRDAAPDASEHPAWRLVLDGLSLPLDDTLAALLPPPAWEHELDALAPRVAAPPLPAGPLAERMSEVAARALAAFTDDPQPPDPGSAPWLAQALADASLPAATWAHAAATLAAGLEPGPVLERVRAAALARRDTFDPASQVALRALVEALPAAELAQQLLDLELSFSPLADSDVAPLAAEAWVQLLERASGAAGPAELWARVGAAVSQGRVDVADLRALAAPALSEALAGLGGGFSLRIQNGLQRLALTLAGGDDPQRLAVTIDAVRTRIQGDKELRQRLSGQLQAALEQAPPLRTPAVFDALRALAK